MPNATKPSHSRSQLPGVIERLVGDSLGYLRSDLDSKTFSFVPAVIEKYNGQSFRKLGVVEKRLVKFSLNSTGQVVTKISLRAPRSRRLQARARKKSQIVGKQVNAAKIKTVGAKSAFPVTTVSVPQIELHPNDNATGDIRITRALPPKTRAFTKLVDTANLWPGDLLLTRNVNADDYVSKMISRVQRDGYAPVDLRWVHVAMYLGDGELVEATFENPVVGEKVTITSLDEYSDGTNILRFRRSKFIKEERDGWHLCVPALSRLKEPYDRFLAIQMWMDVVVKGFRFFTSRRRKVIGSGIVCSTLYADAHNEATRRALGEVNGVCLPAWLSASDDFVDVKVSWSTIL